MHDSRHRQRQPGAAENRAAGLTARCCDVVGLTLRHRQSKPVQLDTVQHRPI